MVRANYNIRNQVIDLTTNKIRPVIDNLYKESLRSLLHIMGDLYYVDGNGNKVKVRCTTGNPERMASRIVADNTMELPLISISETATTNSDERRRYSHVIISEKGWDPKTRRATRVVSLAPRPVNITYEINIWTKYKSDMDMLRAAIFTMFNPDLDIRTKFSDYSRAFLVDERDLGSLTANDTEDRAIQKAITISLETYIPSPKFKVTSTGEIRDFFFKVDLEPNDLVGSDSIPVITEDVTIGGDTPAPVPPYDDGIVESTDTFLSLDTLSLLLSENISVVLRDSLIDLGIVGLTTSALDIELDAGVALGNLNTTLSALDFGYTTAIGTINTPVDLGLLSLTTSALSMSLDSGIALNTIDVTLSALDLVYALQEEGVLSLGTLDLVTSAFALHLDGGVNLDTVNVTLSALDLVYALQEEGYLSLGTIGLITSALTMHLDAGVGLGTIGLATSAITMHLNAGVGLGTIGLATAAASMNLNSGLSFGEVGVTLSTSNNLLVGLDFGVYNLDTPDPDF